MGKYPLKLNDTPIKGSQARTLSFSWGYNNLNFGVFLVLILQVACVIVKY